MADQADLFVMYRWLLATVCTVYAVVCIARSLWQWLIYFAQSRPQVVLGHYAGALLLRTRVQRFGWDFVQIAGLLAILGYVVYLHHRVAM